MNTSPEADTGIASIRTERASPVVNSESAWLSQTAMFTMSPARIRRAVADALAEGQLWRSSGRARGQSCNPGSVSRDTAMTCTFEVSSSVPRSTSDGSAAPRGKLQPAPAITATSATPRDRRRAATGWELKNGWRAIEPRTAFYCADRQCRHALLGSVPHPACTCYPSSAVWVSQGLCDDAAVQRLGVQNRPWQRPPGVATLRPDPGGPNDDQGMCL